MGVTLHPTLLLTKSQVGGCEILILCNFVYVKTREKVHSNEAVGRFVIGLAADVKILEGEGLKEYIKTYEKKYIQKLSATPK